MSPRRKDALTAAAIFGGALCLRLLQLQQVVANDPFFEQPSVDGLFFHEWALRIAQGEWLGDEVFYLGPLYPYFLGVLYSIAGPNLLLVKLVQCVIGSLSCVLVWSLARAVFDRRVAALAGAMAASYSMLIFYEGTLMIVNLQVPLILGVTLLTVRALDQPSRGRWLAVGLLLGLSALARPTALLFGPPTVAWLFFSLRSQAPLARRALYAALCCAGATLPLSLSGLHNYAVSGDFVLVTYTGGYNLWMGNNPRAKGTFTPPALGTHTRVDDPLEMQQAFRARAEQVLERELSPSEVSSFWRDEALSFVVEQPGAWLRLELEKLAYFVNALEIWTNRSVHLSREFSWVLRLPLLDFGVVAPLGLLGIAVSRRRWQRLVPLYCTLAAYLGFALLFFTLSRYRMPMVPVLIVFAAHGGVWLFDAIRGRELRRLALALPFLALATAIVHRDMGAPDLAMAYYNLGNQYQHLGKSEKAIVSYRKALERDADHVSTWNNLALACESAGDTTQAIEAWQWILDWAEQRGSARYRERALRHLRPLGVDPAPGP